MPRIGLCMLSVSPLAHACLWPAVLSWEVPWGLDFLLILPTSLPRVGPTLVLSCCASSLLGSIVGLCALNLSATSFLPGKKRGDWHFSEKLQSIPHISCTCPLKVSRGQVPSLPHCQLGDGEGRHMPWAAKRDLQSQMLACITRLHSALSLRSPQD